MWIQGLLRVKETKELSYKTKVDTRVNSLKRLHLVFFAKFPFTIYFDYFTFVYF